MFESYAAHDLSDEALGGPIRIDGDRFIDQHGRTLQLRGLNISGAGKLPTTPNGLSHLSEGFYEHRTVSFIGRPFPLEDAPFHFARLQQWGMPLIRLLVTWESISHAGPNPNMDLDLEYIEYLRKLIEMMPKYGIKCFICAHQDVWSRFSGGSGAPGWTFEAAGLDIEAFTDTGAAYVHSQDELRRANAPPNEKEPSGPFVWPSGYQKLAAATMATLFWAGDVFAPTLTCQRSALDGSGNAETVSIQTFLQDAYFEAFGRLADAVRGLEACIGFEAMNEPHRGLVNLHHFHKWNYDTDLHIGHYPTLAESLALASGHAQNVHYYVKSWPFPTRISHRSLIDPKGRSAWLPASAQSGPDRPKGLGSCVWKAHGVWEWDSDKRVPVILQYDYFNVDHRAGREGQPVEWYRDFYAPFLVRFSDRVNRGSKAHMSFVEPIPNEFMPPWHPSEAAEKQRYATPTVITTPRPQGLVFAPHFYDLALLFSKTTSFVSVNVQGLSRGMFLPLAVYFGARGMARNYTKQLGNIVSTGRRSLGPVPTLVGETGIPFDLDGGAALRSGDYGVHRRIMHALITGLEAHGLSYTLWNYNPDNHPDHGDGWNREDFSLVHAGTPDTDGFDPHPSPRAAAVFVRPYAAKLAGRMISTAWNPSTKRFEFIWKSIAQSKTDTSAFFVPCWHYGDQVHVSLSDGEWHYNHKTQTLYVRHGSQAHHRLVLQPIGSSHQSHSSHTVWIVLALLLALISTALASTTVFK